MLRLYSTRIASVANTDNQEVFSKQWPVPVTLKAMKFETSEAVAQDLDLRAKIDGEVFIYDSDPAVLELVDWIPMNTGPAKPNGKLEVEVDNTHAANTPDIRVNCLIDVGVAPPNNLPWIHGEHETATTATAFTKQFSKDAQIYWTYLCITAGTFMYALGGNRINGDDADFIEEPSTPPQGMPYPYAIPANVDLTAVTVAATGDHIIAINKPR